MPGSPTGEDSPKSNHAARAIGYRAQLGVGMTDFAVVREALRAAAAQAGDAAEAIRPTSLSGPVTQISGALPGGESEPTAQRLAVTWNAELSAIRDALTHHADNLGSSDGTYGGVDGAARDRFSAG